MAVAFDAKMTTGNGGGGNTLQKSASTSGVAISGTPITVGASASLLAVAVNLDFNVIAGITFTGVTATWNGVSMNQQALNNNFAHSFVTCFFTLVNPTSGAKTLSVTWTATGSTTADVYIGAVSFTGTDTSAGSGGGIKAADNTTATATTTITVPSDVNGATVATFIVNGGTPTMNFTTFWADSALNPGGGGSYHLGGTSNAHTFTGAGGTVADETLSGIHVIAPSVTAAVPSILLLGAGQS